MIGSLLFLWKSIRCVTLSKLLSLVLTTPWGSTSSRCFLPLPCIPVSTYWPGLPWLSRTKKSPSLTNSSSASLLEIGPWNQSSPASCALSTAPWGGCEGKVAAGMLAIPPPGGAKANGDMSKGSRDLCCSLGSASLLTYSWREGSGERSVERSIRFEFCCSLLPWGGALPGRSL